MKKKILLVSLLTAGMLFSCSDPAQPEAPADGSTTSQKSTPKASSVQRTKVTFDLNYQGAPAATNKTVGNDGKVTLPADPVKEDSIFIEWNTKADGTGTKVTKDDVYTTDTTVYAKWHHHQYGTETKLLAQLEIWSLRAHSRLSIKVPDHLRRILCDRTL